MAATCHSLPIWPAETPNPARLGPFISHTATCPALLVQSRSEAPSPLKSPTPYASHSAPMLARGTATCVSAPLLFIHRVAWPTGLPAQAMSDLVSALKSPTPMNGVVSVIARLEAC